MTNTTTKTRGLMGRTMACLLLALTVMLAPQAPANSQEPANAKGDFQLVGMGPGDLDLMTPRQLAAIEAADVVFCDQKTRDLLASHVNFQSKQVIEGYGLIFPFYGKDCATVPAEAGKRWGKSCDEFHQKQAEFAAMVRGYVAAGKKVVMTTGGDPTIYGPGIWTMLELKDIDAKVVPGLSAFNAANAALKVSLGEVIITAPFKKDGGNDAIEKLAGHERATMVIFMPRDMKELLARLAAVYAADTPVAVVADAGRTGKQRTVSGTIADIGGKLADLDVKNSMVYVGEALAGAADLAAKPSNKAAKGKYYLVGMGPGDADLATIRALEVIKKADLIFVGGGIKERFASQLAGKNVVEGYHRLFPFYGKDCSKISERDKSKERMSCEEYHRRQAEFAAMTRKAVAEGKIVAMLDSGDPLVYGPCAWSLTELRDIDTEVAPGMSCFNAANAAIGAGVTEGRHSHSVLLASGWSVEEMAPHQATMVLFTMRTEFKKFIDGLSKHYPADTPVAIVFNAGYRQTEKVLRGTLGSIMQQTGDKKLPFQHLLYVGDFLTNDKPY